MGGAEAKHNAFVEDIEVGKGFGFFDADAFEIGGYIGDIPATSVVAVAESRDRFYKRSAILRETRRWLEARGFMEVETPILQPHAGGATAKPFTTHYNALDREMFLRIAPELYLKRLIIGGFDKVFEIGRDFRNEGLDRTHNPEFTVLELYQAYGDRRSMMDVIEGLLPHLCDTVIGSRKVRYG